MITKVVSTHKDFRFKYLKPAPVLEIIQGAGPGYINLRLLPSGKKGRKLRHIVSPFTDGYVNTETFTINDIKRLIKRLQKVVKLQEERL
jgi:hypothetical protein